MLLEEAESSETLRTDLEADDKTLSVASNIQLLLDQLQEPI
jgi:hypothetical protein